MLKYITSPLLLAVYVANVAVTLMHINAEYY